VTVTKVNGFRAPYRSGTFKDIVAQIAGRSGLVDVKGVVTEDLVTITLPPFSFVQNGLLVSKSTSTGISRPNMVAPYFISVSAPTPNDVNDLIFSFVKSPSDLSSEEVILAGYDGTEWRFPVRLSLAGVLDAIEEQNVATMVEGPTSGLKTIVDEDNYVNGTGSLTDRSGQPQIFKSTASFPVIADDPDFPRVDRIVFRRPVDVEARVGMRKFLLGSTYSATPAALYPLALSGSDLVSQKSKILIGGNNEAFVVTARGYGNKFSITLRTVASSRQSMGLTEIVLAQATHGVFDAVVTSENILMLVYQAEGSRLNLLRYDLTAAAPVATSFVTDSLDTRPSSEPCVCLAPNESRLFIVYKFNIAANASRIYFKSVNLFGETVTGGKDLTANSGLVGSADMYVSDDFYVHVTWVSLADGIVRYRIFDDIGATMASMPAAVIVSGATKYQGGTIASYASSPKIRVTDSREIFISFLQVKPLGQKGLAIWQSGSATILDYNDTAEDILAYDILFDENIGGYMADISIAAGVKYFRLHHNLVALSIPLFAAGASFIAMAKDKRGSLYHVSPDQLLSSGTDSYTVYKSNVAVRNLGPGLITGATTVNLTASQALLQRTGFDDALPRVGEKVTISGSLDAGNNADKIITAVDIVAFNDTADFYRLTFDSAFSSAEEAVPTIIGDYETDRSIHGEFFSINGFGSTGKKSPAETEALAFLTEEKDSDVLLSRMVLPDDTILNWIPGDNARGATQNYLIAHGHTALSWQTNVLTMSGDPLKLTNIFSDETYEIAIGAFPMAENDALYIKISPDNLSPVPAVTSVSRLPWDQNIACLGFILDGVFKGAILAAGGVDQIVDGETTTLGEALPKNIRPRVGLPLGDDQYEAYTSVTTIAADDSYPAALSKLDVESEFMRLIAAQNKDISLSHFGAWTWNFNTKMLEQPFFYLNIPGVSLLINSYAAGSIALADGDFAYVTLNRYEEGGTTTVVSTAHQGNDLNYEHIKIIAWRDGDAVVLCTGQRLQPNQRTSLYGDRAIVDVRLVDSVSTSYPTNANPNIDGRVVVEGDLVLFLKIAGGVVASATGVGSALSWTEQEVFAGSANGYLNSMVSVSDGQHDAGSIFIRDNFGFRELQNSDATFDQTGFSDLGASTLSFANATRTFTMSSVVGSLFYYTQGNRHQPPSAASIQLPDVEGFYFIYYRGDVLEYATTYSVSAFKGLCFVATVYWDATNKKAVLLGDERHGISMDWATRSYLFETVGTTLISGGQAGSFTTTGAGTADADATLSFANMRVQAQDLAWTIAHSATPTLPFQQFLSPAAKLPILYRDGAVGNWRLDPAGSYPLMLRGGRAAWNNPASWVQTPVADGSFVAMWIFATNDPRNPLVAMAGQRTDTTLEEAIRNNVYDDLLFGIYPSHAMKGVYRLIYQSSATYTNTPKARLQNVTDIRFTRDIGTRAVVAQSHNDLLDRDDAGSHPAIAIATDTSNFSDVLKPTDNNLQLALDRIDNDGASKIYVDNYFNQLRLSAHATDTSRVKLSGSDITLGDGTIRVQTLSGLIMSFTGAEIDFFGAGAGNIYAADGTTVLSTFTVGLPAVGQYRWYAVSLSALGQDTANRSLAVVKVDVGSSDASTAAAAPRARFSGAKPIGQFCISNSGGTAVLSQIVQLGSGSGDGTGSGGGTETNYISQDLSEFEAGTTTGIATYNDAAAIPVDGAGGTNARLSFNVTQTNVLNGAYSLIISKAAGGSALGEGVSIPATVSRGFQKANLSKVGFLFETSGAFASSELGIWVYDVTNSKLITPKVMQNVLPGRGEYLATWEQNLGVDYRLLFHVKGTAAAAWTITGDKIILGPGVTGRGFSDASPQLAGSIQDHSGDVSAWQVVDGMTQKNGWAVADGSTFDILKYPDLYAEIGTKWNLAAKQDAAGGNYTAPAAGFARLPDLRGVFMRGAGTSSRADGSNDVAVALAQFGNDTSALNSITLSGGSYSLNYTAPTSSVSFPTLNGSAPTVGGTFADASHTHALPLDLISSSLLGYQDGASLHGTFGFKTLTNIGGSAVFGTRGTFFPGPSSKDCALSSGPYGAGGSGTGTASPTISGGSYSLSGGSASFNAGSASLSGSAPTISSTDLETAPRWVGANRLVKLYSPSNVSLASERKRSPLGAGFIVANASPKAQAGWLACDGGVYLQTDYPDLFDEIGTSYALAVDTSTGLARTTAPATGYFRVPDYRGVFIRSVGTTNIGSTTLGLWQDDATARNGLTPGNLSGSFLSGDNNANHTHTYGGTIDPVVMSHSHGVTTNAGGTHHHETGSAYNNNVFGQGTSRSPMYTGAGTTTYTAALTNDAGSHTHTGYTDSADTSHSHTYSGTTSGVSSVHQHTTLVTFSNPGLTGDTETRPQSVGAYHYIKAWDDTLDLSGFALASATNFGMVSTGAQSFAGPKDFVDHMTAKSASYRAITAILASGSAIVEPGMYFIISAAATTQQIFTAVGNDGKVFEAKNAGAGVCTLDGNGSELIEGALTFDLNSGESARCVAFNGNWYLI
jgi:hypothetical protein